MLEKVNPTEKVFSRKQRLAKGNTQLTDVQLDSLTKTGSGFGDEARHAASHAPKYILGPARARRDQSHSAARGETGERDEREEGNSQLSRGSRLPGAPPLPPKCNVTSVCVGNVASSSSSSSPHLLPPQSLGGREDEREAEAVIDTAPIDTPPERDLYAAHNKWADRQEGRGGGRGGRSARAACDGQKHNRG